MARERQPPIWQRLGYRSRYAYRKAVGRYTPGTTGAERGRRARAAREAAFRASAAPSRVSWQSVPGGQGRAVVTGDPAIAREALRQAQAEGRQVYIALLADTAYAPGSKPKKHPEGRVFLGSVPPGVVLALAAEGGVLDALEEIARRQGSEVENIYEVTISSYPR